MVEIKTSRNNARKLVSDYIGRSLLNHQAMMALEPNFRFYNTIFEIVHHINGDPLDNQLENLYVFKNNGEHIDYHRKIARWSKQLGGKSMKDKIEYLKTFPDLKSNLDELKELNEKGLTVSHYWDD